MADEQIIRQLIQEVMVSNRSPEEVCRDHPELLGDVRARWQDVRVVEQQLDALFPSSGPTPQNAGSIAIDSVLPLIPGYEVLEILGRGGMGVVYKAQHLALKRPVALKMVLAGAYATEAERQRLRREAQAVAALVHPNIVTIHDVGECDGKPFFTMELVEGANLAQRLAGTPQLARVAAALVATLAEVVHFAHQMGIVHRDLKPANVLLTQQGSPKITDFGLAWHFEGEPAMTFTGVQVGTPSYMAPEQASGLASALGPGVDIYALGALLYEMLTGRPPFRAETALETQRQVIEEAPAPPSRLNAKTPRDLETICMKCLQKDPSARYATALELKEDLNRFLSGEPIAARRTGAAVRVLKWVRRHPARASAVIGAFAAVSALLGALLWTVSVRAAIERAVSDDLTEAVRLEQASDWRAARNILERAKTRLGATAARDRLALRASVIETELNLVDRLGAMRFERAANREVEFDHRKWWDAYRKAFVEAGLLTDGDTPEAFAARIAQSPARTALVDAMDDMAICAANPVDLEWLLRATRRADPDPWRDKARDKAVWFDRKAIATLARNAPVESQPVPVLLNLAGRMLEISPPEAESLIRRIQAAHPSDFWTNFALAETLDERQNADAIGYYRAAIALRPEATAAHINLGLALEAQSRIQEAIDSMNRAVSLDPHSFVARYNLADWLIREGQTEAALEHARIATQIDYPQRFLGHYLLGSALAKAGKTCEAAESFRRAVQLSPEDNQLRESLARASCECNASTTRPQGP